MPALVQAVGGNSGSTAVTSLAISISTTAGNTWTNAVSGAHTNKQQCDIFYVLNSLAVTSVQVA